MINYIVFVKYRCVGGATLHDYLCFAGLLHGYATHVE